MPGECLKRLDPCPNGAGHPSIADCRATARLVDQHNYLGRSSRTAFGTACGASAGTVGASSCSHPATCRAKQMGCSVPVPSTPAQGVQSLPQLLVPIANAFDFSQHPLLDFSR